MKSCKAIVCCLLFRVVGGWKQWDKPIFLLRNTNELQDFISDLHSYPVVLSIPWFHNHYKWGIILKRIKHAFLYQFQWWKQKSKWYIINQTWVSKLFLRSLFPKSYFHVMLYTEWKFEVRYSDKKIITSLIHSFIHSIIHSFIHSFGRSFIHSFI